ncbi:formimidoylglutamase [Ochrovirga pacifica]|uniref:formimidoylglutamase n=1 Tax=Ochrovirga pacifica TaxID=1042376 RepID=UPI000255A538|nr:formimidoylglutamase [Ochrovirga pacifica]
MIQDFFTPVPKHLSECDYPSQTLGNCVVKNTECEGFPDLDNVQVALFDVRESRGADRNLGTEEGGEKIREELYQLYQGNWEISMVDLGSILAGNELKDTYYAVKETVFYLFKKNILPILLGGSIDLIYANYRGYDNLDQMVNLAVVSPYFGFGKEKNDENSTSYLTKIVMEEPCNLFNYANLGYQTYYNSSDEIALIEDLYFESYRLGELKDITIAEPVMRDADIVSIDMSAVRASDAPANEKANPNGLFGDKVCAIARYAGISDKVTSFGVYEYNPLYDERNLSAKLIAQIIWYFLEGYSLRTEDYPFGSKENYFKYLVPFEDYVIEFYQSDKSLRWWMKIELNTKKKYTRHILVPCAEEDYLNAIDQKMPERWFKALKKMSTY